MLVPSDVLKPLEQGILSKAGSFDPDVEVKTTWSDPRSGRLVATKARPRRPTHRVSSLLVTSVFEPPTTQKRGFSYQNKCQVSVSISFCA